MLVPTQTETINLSNNTRLRIALFLGLFMVFMGFAVMWGWHVQLPAVFQPDPLLVPMQYNTALCFALSGLALSLFAFRRPWLMRAIAGIVMLIAVLTLIQYAMKTDFGIDQLLMKHYITTKTSEPGRMAPGTAVGFVLVSCSIFLLSLYRHQSERLFFSVSILSSVLIALASATILGYLFNVTPLVGWEATTHMAPQTAIGDILLGIGIIICSATLNLQRGDVYKWMGLFSFILVLTLSFLLSYGLIRDDTEQQRESLRSESHWLADRLQSEFLLRLHEIKRMAQRWNEAGGTPKTVWYADALAYVQDLPGLQALEWLDTDGRVRWLVPVEGNEEVLDTIPNKEPVRLLALEKSRFEKREVVAGPISLIQGGVGLLVFNPVFRNSNFDGFIVAVLKVEDILTNLLLANPRDYSAAVITNQQTVFQTEPMSVPVDFVATFPLKLGEAEMQLQIFQEEVTPAYRGKILPWIALGGGIVLASFLMLTFWLWSITARRADEMLQINAKNQSLLDAVPDIMFQLDEHGRFIDFRSRDINELAMPPEAFIGRTLTEVLPAELAELTQNAINKAKQQGLVKVIEYQMPNIQGEVHDYEARISNLKTGGILAIVRNISEQKRVERLKREFVSIVSHELRTPLTSIQGSLALISGGVVGNISPQVTEMINLALRNSEHLNALISDILDIDKIEQGKMKFNLQRINISSVVEQSVAENRAYAQQLDVTLHISHLSPDLNVYADPDRLKQVIFNLLANAAKFSEAGSVVEVRIAKNNAMVRVEIRDYGQGIPEAFRNRMFTKFSQADSSTTRSKRGTGLGLAISKAIVEQMQGVIDYRCESKGTTFYFELPLV